LDIVDAENKVQEWKGEGFQDASDLMQLSPGVTGAWLYEKSKEPGFGARAREFGLAFLAVLFLPGHYDPVCVLVRSKSDLASVEDFGWHAKFPVTFLPSAPIGKFFYEFISPDIGDGHLDKKERITLRTLVHVDRFV
jgi:hypothetical protein